MPIPSTPVDPDFHLAITQTFAGPSTALDVPLKLGTAAVPANNIYGLAFTVNFDPSLVDSASIGMDFSNSWLGTINTDMITIEKNFFSNGKLEVAITRINQTDVNGNGQIGDLNITTAPNITGNQTLTLSLTNVRVISSTEVYIPVNLISDDVMVAIDDDIVRNKMDLEVYPNPTSGSFTVQGAHGNIRIYNLLGNLILESTKPEIDLNSHASGVYFVKVGETVCKLIKQ